MKMYPMSEPALTEHVVDAACAAAAVRSDRRALNRIAPMFANVLGQSSAPRTAGVTLNRSGHGPGSPPS